MLHIQKLLVFVLVILTLAVAMPVTLAQVMPAALPETGGQSSPWTVLVLAAGLIALVSGAMLVMAHRISQTKLI